MRRLLVVLIVTIVVASACGSDNTTIDAGADPDFDPGDDSTTDPGDADQPAPDGQDADVDEPLGAGPYPIADLQIMVKPDGADGVVLAYRLACLGDTATLTGDTAPNSAESMCLALNDDAIGTRLIAGVPGDRLCTEIYGGPQVAEIKGTLDGESVDTTIDRTNGCGIDDWDRLLSILLPFA